MSQPSLFGVSVERSAVISECGLYRYKLGRRWDVGAVVNFVMLNPSTADANIDDPTIRRCVGFAKSWGYGALVVTNLFAWRATDPSALKTAPDPIGPENRQHLIVEASEASLVICAWGNHGKIGNRSAIVRKQFFDAGVRVYCLARSKSGEPGHPLYLKADLEPVGMEFWKP